MLADLRSIQIFRDLSNETLEKISQAAITRVYAPGQIIQVEGDAPGAAYFIMDGAVRVYRLSLDGREQVLATLGPGASFNTVAPLLQKEINPGSARALHETRLLALRSEDYVTLLREQPDFSFAMLGEFAHRLVHLTGLVENLALHSVRGRIARFLLDQADGLMLERRWTQDEMAEHLGTVRDVIGRTLREFADAGYIRREGRQIVLVDRLGLEKEAQF